MTETQHNEKPHFHVEEWYDNDDMMKWYDASGMMKGCDEICDKLEDKIIDKSNSVDELAELSEESSIVPFGESKSVNVKTYNKRRLSDSFPDVQQPCPESVCSTPMRKKLSKFLPLLLIQGLTKNHVPVKKLSFHPEKDQEQRENVTNILQSLLTVLKAAIGSPSEKQTLEYCQTVLVETTIKVDCSDVIYFFLKTILSGSPSFKHAALALLHTYCSDREFDILLASNFLKNVISLYNDNDMKVLELSWMIVNAVIQNLKFGDQVKIVPDVCLAVKWAVFLSRNGDFIPGLCHSKGFESIFPLYEKVLLKGLMRDKKRAAQALRQLIMFSSEDALQPFLCSLTFVLICNISKFKNEDCIYTKVVLVETLTTLIAKAGVKLKLHFSRIESTLLNTVRTDSRTLQLKCIRGLCCFVHFNTMLDTLYQYIFEAIRREGYPVRKIMLFVLRCVIKCACVPIPEMLRQKILIQVISMLDHESNICRIAAAGCVGTMFGYLPSSDSEKVMKVYFLDDNQTLPWRFRHSKCTALMVALKEFPSKLILEEKSSERIGEIIVNYVASDNEDIALCGIKACGYYMLFKLSQVNEQISSTLLDAFCEAMNYPSIDIICTFAVVANFLANRIALPASFIKKVVPVLVNGTKDKRKKVESTCKYALVAVLDMYKDDKTAQAFLDTLEPVAKEAFQDVLKDLKEVAKLTKPKKEELDFTVM